MKGIRAKATDKAGRRNMLSMRTATTAPAAKRTSEAQLRANKKYSNSKWRPNVYLNMDTREDIEKHFASKGFKSFNEYVINLINQDMSNEK